MAHTIKALAISIGAALALTSLPSHAEITLLKQDPQAGDPLSRLNFTVGGSIRFSATYSLLAAHCAHRSSCAPTVRG